MSRGLQKPWPPEEVPCGGEEPVRPVFKSQLRHLQAVTVASHTASPSLHVAGEESPSLELCSHQQPPAKRGHS